MRRALGFTLALTLMAGMAVSCGGDEQADTTTTTTTTTTTASTTTSGSSGTADTGNAKVDDYCNKAQDLAKAAQQALDSKDSSAYQDAVNQAADLAKQAAELTPEIVKDPSLGQKLQECTKVLTDVHA